MINKIKKMAMLLMFAATVISFSACEKDNEDDSTGGGSNNYPASIASTQWMWDDQIDDFSYAIVGIWENNNGCSVSIIESQTSDYYYEGTYTYSSGNGTMNLENIENYEHTTATFSISGSTMTLKIKGMTYTLTQRS